MNAADLKKQSKKTGQELLTYISRATTPYHAAEEGVIILRNAGFQELDIRKGWEVTKGGSYFVRPYGTSLFAFTIGENVSEETQFYMAAAHTDHPCLHIKPVAELLSKEYLRLNIEVYGGPILNTWLDRPLSIAGRVALRSEQVYEPRMILIDVRRPILTIPNLAIHMNHEVNKGVELKKQGDMIPLLGRLTEDLNKENYFIDFLAKELGVNSSDILDFDLYIYNAEEGMTVGMQEEFISCPRLDNLTSCYALLKSIIAGRRKDGINLIALYDNEEIGSRTKQGADSALLSMMLEKLYAALGMKKEILNEAILRSYLLSVDVAHALHPNRLEKYDAVNYSLMNDGVVFKINSNQRYTFDTEAVAIACQLCEKAGVKYKKFVNHADVAGGGTLGPIISAWLPMKTVDIGIPLLAMHSSRELMGIEDQVHLEHMVTALFSE